MAVTPNWLEGLYVMFRNLRGHKEPTTRPLSGFEPVFYNPCLQCFLLNHIKQRNETEAVKISREDGAHS